MTKTFALSLLAFAAAAGSASATIVGDPLTVTATNSQGSATFRLIIGTHGTYNPETGDYSYSSSAPIVLEDNGRVIATVNTLNFSIIGDPQINLAFSAVAGAADTLLTFSSGLNAFAPLFNPSVSGVANMTITDAFGSNGATMVGNHPPGFAYLASYNGSSIYAQRLFSMNAGPDNTANATEGLGGVIPGSVTDMSASYSFTLSARDSVSGTSVYSVVPTPAALSLLGLGGLVLARRRR